MSAASSSSAPASSRTIYLTFGLTLLVICSVALRSFSHLSTEIATLRGTLSHFEHERQQGGDVLSTSSSRASATTTTHASPASAAAGVIESPAYASLGPPPRAQPSAWTPPAADDDRDISKGTY